MELPVAHTVAQPLTVRFAVAIVAGLGATVVMTVAMDVLPEGYVPPYVAASVLFATAPGVVSKRQADAAHYGAGMLAGVLFEIAVLGLEAVRDATLGVQVVVANVLTLSDLVAAVFVVVFLFVFFAYGVFPRHGERLYDHEETRRVVRRDWLVSATVYGVALLVAVLVLYAFLPAV
jgi:hypothetical protein